MTRLGSSLSLFGVVRFGSALSVFDFVPVGSSLSLRSFARIGSSLSLVPHICMGSALAVFDRVNFGSSFSLRSICRIGSGLSIGGNVRLGSSVSVFDFSNVGSSFSYRSFGRLGAAVSIFSGLRIGSSFSVMDMATVGSSFSLRSFARFGASISIFGHCVIGDDSQGIVFTTPGKAIYATQTNNAQVRRISFPDPNAGSGGGPAGILHGTWQSDSTITTSDRRLKNAITPLHKTLIQRMSQVNDASHAPGKLGSSSGDTRATKPKNRQDAVDWILRELRPVSFSFKQGIESKSIQGTQRYGFVAQEVQKTVPNLVQDTGSTKSMLYQDLIAMITMAAQDHQERLEQHNGEVGKLRGLLKRLSEKLGHLQKRVVRVIGPFEPKTGLRGTPTPAQHRSKEEHEQRLNKWQ